MNLLMIGYWNSPEQLGEWIDPRGLSETGCNNKELVVNYLSSGKFCGGELGYSWCRYCCSTPAEEMGAAILTDGAWAWPEGLAHYVLEHNLRLPDEFLEHVGRNGFTVPEDLLETDLVSATLDFDYWERWCAQMKSAPGYSAKLYDPEKVELARLMSPNSGVDPLGIL